MASKSQSKKKEPVIELSLYREEVEEIDTKVSIPRHVYEETMCSMDEGTTYKWGELYYMFKET
jgi:hypothetical protein